MRKEVEGLGVRIARPAKRAELRVRRLVDSITPDQVVAALDAAGGCPEGEIAIGTIRSSPCGIGSVWSSVPLSAARKVAKVGKVTVGWMSVSVDMLAGHPLQCNRCLE